MTGQGSGQCKAFKFCTQKDKKVFLAFNAAALLEKNENTPEQW